MKITIYPDQEKIRGGITEIKTDKAKILIDPWHSFHDSTEIPHTKEEICRITAGVDAILYTSCHGDHNFFHKEVDESIPQYVSEDAKSLMDVMGVVIPNLIPYHNNSIIKINDIEIAALQCCDSVFDSYILYVLADDVDVLHIGNLHIHDYFGRDLIDAFRNLPSNPDYLIADGTILSCSNKESSLEKAPTKRNISEAIKGHKYCFALGEENDIDYLATIYKVCLTTKRYFVVNKRQRLLLELYMKRANSDVDESLLIELDEKASDKMKSAGFIMPVYASMCDDIRHAMALCSDESPFLIYSLWTGYYKVAYNGTENQIDSDVKEIRSLFDENNICDLYSSGDASEKRLETVFNWVKPKRIIPVNRYAGYNFSTMKHLTRALKEQIIIGSKHFDNADIEIIEPTVQTIQESECLHKAEEHDDDLFNITTCNNGDTIKSVKCKKPLKIISIKQIID